MMKVSLVFFGLGIAASYQRAFAWIAPAYTLQQHVHPHQTRASSSSKVALDMAAVGIFFGTSTGNTQTVAEMIYQAFGDDVAAEPVDVDTIDAGKLAEAFGAHDALIVGTPTWNTGADSERSGTGWDELYYKKLPALKKELEGKPVAVFGLGDQISYGENYADATGELFDVFESLGCQMFGAWSQEGYEHQASKSIRGDKFCGLLLDMINQEDLTEARVQKWVAQLKEEGILRSASSAAVASPSSAAAAVATKATTTTTAPSQINGDVAEKANAELRTMVENSQILDQTISALSGGGFIPHYNPVSKSTMWISPDGRRAYKTMDTTTTNVRP